MLQASVRLETTTGVTLLQELQRLLQREGLPLETALRFFTENPARVLGQTGKKGVVAPGADADLLVMSGDYQVRHLLSKGREAVWEGQAIRKGKFENG